MAGFGAEFTGVVFGNIGVDGKGIPKYKLIF